MIDLDLERPIHALVQEHVTQRAAIATADDQHAVWVGVRKHRDVNELLMVGKLLVHAGLERAAEDERSSRPLQFQHFQALPGRGLRVQPLQYPIALLTASVRWLGEPVLPAWFR